MSLASRTVVVLGGGGIQGSGALLTDHLVLTCAHVVRGGGHATVAHPRLSGSTQATVAWVDHDLDAALLLTAGPVLPVLPARLGTLHTGHAVPGCEITGYPGVQRYGPERHLESDQYTATALPTAGQPRGLLVCELDGPPPVNDTRDQPLRGLSGGPVFAGNVLIGIARQLPHQREGRRVECVPLAPLLASKPFRLVYEQTGTPLRHEPVHGHFPQDARYEEDYAAALGAAYRRTKIFGLDELGRRDSEWDLDTAYLSLEAQRHPGAGPAPGSPRRIDTLLPGRPRVLLRGDAGAGKTTLLWWLAAHAASRTLSPELAPLNGLVPFVVPLRTLRAEGGTFPSPAQLPDAARLVVDRAPEGWVGRVLESGRGLLLVDGLDEVPGDDREQAHQWLSRFLDRYPDVRCVVTVRPLAVEPGWLDAQDFEELRLLPMGDRDIEAFVAAWHRAARLDDDDHETLGMLERDLIQRFTQNHTLRDLARTPLLCAVICALHRRRQGLLPETRWSLYDSALTMLLGDRDRQRRIDAPEGITMSAAEQAQLLQRIAVWLVRGGQSELSRASALRQLERALPGMERLRSQGSSGMILNHLLNRSGVLQERAEDTYQFAHRTFQDFLAAKEFVEGDQLHELLSRAGSQHWYDVILLAAGHCDRRDHPVLVNGLLDYCVRDPADTVTRGETAVLAALSPADTVTREEIAVLAALCAQHATWLDEPTRERVHAAVAALFPPKGYKTVRVLARLGPAALAHLPDPAQVTDDEELRLLIDLINEIGGAEALPHARRWALAHPELEPVFTVNWDEYPIGAYAREVLSTFDSPPLMLTTPEKLAALRHLPSARILMIVGDHPAAALHASLRGGSWTLLVFQQNPGLTDLAFLADCAALESVSLSGCPAVRDLGALAALPSLGSVDLDMSRIPGTVLAATASRELRSLRLNHLTAGQLSQLPVHPRLSLLSIEEAATLEIDSLDGWTNLRRLELRSPTPVRPLLAALRRAPQVAHLALRLSSVTEFAAEQPVPSLESLELGPAADTLGMEEIPRVFPALKQLLIALPSRADGADLSALQALPGCTVTVA
ncbi:NACHT domain-containing protein [Streptomyces sp. NPDC058195]|uniref:NACHT domain-containing protein n=1 Tax=Streptomyces sp. NPDC058195 TaxID=3346375 RepID=UPI0036EA8DFD